MDESTFGWLIEYEQQLREAGYDEYAARMGVK